MAATLLKQKGKYSMCQAEVIPIKIHKLVGVEYSVTDLLEYFNAW